MLLESDGHGATTLGWPKPDFPCVIFTADRTLPPVEDFLTNWPPLHFMKGCECRQFPLDGTPSQKSLVLVPPSSASFWRSVAELVRSNVRTRCREVLDGWFRSRMGPFEWGEIEESTNLVAHDEDFKMEVHIDPPFVLATFVLYLPSPWNAPTLGTDFFDAFGSSPVIALSIPFERGLCMGFLNAAHTSHAFRSANLPGRDVRRTLRLTYTMSEEAFKKRFGTSRKEASSARAALEHPVMGRSMRLESL